MIRGVRGAVQVKANTREAILEAASELLREMIARNEMEPEMIASIFMTTTPDVTAEFPAYAVRENGFTHVPVICSVEIAVPTAMQSLIRVLILWETEKQQTEIEHVYLGEAAKLRPDLAGDQ
ncbi:MAG: chorismate mutase [bacterium]